MKTIKQPKQYSIKVTRRNSSITMSGTLPELIQKFNYTLDVGKSWQHEKGNSKINMNPKTIKSLITNLINASNNAALNGYSGEDYSLVEETLQTI